jgi:hypothetical protein
VGKQLLRITGSRLPLAHAEITVGLCVWWCQGYGTHVPAMSPNKGAIKHGIGFVNFMTACMAGSFLAGGCWASSCCVSQVAGHRLLGALAHVVFTVLQLCVVVYEIRLACSGHEPQQGGHQARRDLRQLHDSLHGRQLPSRWGMVGKQLLCIACSRVPDSLVALAAA